MAANDIEKLRELISDIQIAMPTTRDADGSIRGSPVATPSRAGRS